MKVIRYYTADHPLVKYRTGDPARGEWKPKERPKPGRKGKRK